MKSAVSISLLFAVTISAGASAQAPAPLTLAAAEQLAIQNHPQLAQANLEASAAQQDTRVTASAYYPTLAGELTGAAAQNGSRLAAGALNNPTVFDRYANGLVLNQLVTDFGRTSNLVQSSKLRADAAGSNVQITKQQVLIGVVQAYYAALEAQALLTVAQQTVDQRQTVTDQVSALTKNQLKSGLDLSFANVNLAQAKLDLASAQNAVAATQAALVDALGLTGPRTFTLQDTAMPAAPSADVAPLVSEALAQRPELAALRFSTASDTAFAHAEADLARPTVSGVASAGLVPWGASQLQDHYAAAGVNVSIPIFNGRQFSARRQAAADRAQASAKTLQTVQDAVTRDVQVAWLNARTAYQRLDLSRQLLQQATEAQTLAQERYNLGLSSIVELSQAQLNYASAESQQTSATYQFQIAAAVLNFQVGTVP